MIHAALKMVAAALLAAVLLAVAGLAAPGGAAAQGLDDPFDPAALSLGERRLAQISLGAAQAYFGPFDGAWNAETAEALDAFLSAQGRTPPALNRDVGALALAAARPLQEAGYDERPLGDGSLTLFVPAAVVSGRDIGRDQLFLASADDALQISAGPTPGEPAEVHARFVSAFQERLGFDGQTLEAKRGGLESFAGTVGRGRLLMSFETPGGWRTVQVDAEGPVALRHLYMIRSGVYAGPPRPEYSARGERLIAIFEALAAEN